MLQEIKMLHYHRSEEGVQNYENDVLFCGEIYCADHRRPDDHKCKKGGYD